MKPQGVVPTLKQTNQNQRSNSPISSPSEASPPRPNSLPISEPKPVPLPSSIRRTSRQPASSPQKTISNAIPRSQPISMKRSDQSNSNAVSHHMTGCDRVSPGSDYGAYDGQRRNVVAVRNANNVAATAPSAIDISSISPPAVQFAIGSPPLGSRRRSTSGGSLSESPPVAPYLWQISPTTQHSPPIRQSTTMSPHLSSGALTKIPTLDSPNFNLIENNNPFHHPLLGTRAFTLPEMNGAAGGGKHKFVFLFILFQWIEYIKMIWSQETEQRRISKHFMHPNFLLKLFWIVHITKLWQS